MNRIKLLAWVLVIGALLAGMVLQAAAAQDLPPQTPGAPNPAGLSIYLPKVVRGQPASSIFGVEMLDELINANPGGPAELMAQAGATWVRRNGLLWSAVEPAPGGRNWSSTLDSELANAAGHNLRSILVIRSTPAWAQKVANSFCGPIKADALDEFAAFVGDAVKRYSGSPYYVKYFELWNEPDIQAFSGESAFGCWGNWDDPYYGGGYYADMLKAAYPAVKQANPSAQVLVGGLLLNCDPRNPPPGSTDGCLPSKFLEGILINGGGAYFDGVSYHAYDYFPKPADVNDPNNGLGVYKNTNWSSAWNTNGPVLILKAQFLREVLSKYGYGWKYLIASEVSVQCGGDSADPYCETGNAQSLSFQNTKAYFAVQSMAAASYLGLRSNIWYSYYGWRDSGLMNGYSGILEAAYSAYRFTGQEINWAASASELAPTPGVKGYEFIRYDKRVWVVWYTGGDPNNGTVSTTVSLASTPRAVYKWVNAGSGTANDGTYQLSPLNQPDASQVMVGRAPVFIEFDR